MTIRLLDDHLINKIAAGEVIERPASVVKELVENAIDAGSRRISVQIANGGIDLIEVTDDGQGIPADQVLLALERHATSKIAGEDDLATIRTMGFRGEALPSIASVSRLQVHTQYGQGSGVRVAMSGGRDVVHEPFATAPGTKVLVHDLFFNTPVRKNFLKSTVSEAIQVHDLMSRLALGRPDISFSYANEKKLYFKTPGSGDLRDTVIAIFGRDFIANFIDLDWSGERYRLRGLISKPGFRRLNRKNQVFYVNNRLIKSPLLARAVDEGYRGTLLAREYPALFLFLEVPAGEVDVNVHPQKTEVRFRDDKAIFQLVSQAIKATLAGPEHQYHHHRDDSFQLNMPLPTLYPDPGTASGAESLFIEESTTLQPDQRTLDSDWVPAQDDQQQQEGELAVIGQCFDGYIVVEQGQSVWLVDQHAAHERILFHRLRQRGQNQTNPGQVLTFPQAFDLSGAAMDTLQEHQAVLQELGFDIEALGPNSVILRSAPASLQGQEIAFINEWLEVLGGEQALDFKDEIYALMACKQAVKAGDRLSRAEMMMLIDDLIRTPEFRHCPHGRPTLVEMSRQDLEKRFKRK